MIDLTGDDSNDEAPPPSLVQQLQSFTGASEADAAAALADAQGSLEGAAAALLTRNSGAAPPPPATEDDLSAIRKLRDEQRRDDAARAAAPPVPPVPPVPRPTAGSGDPMADFLATAGASEIAPPAPTTIDDQMAAIRKLRAAQYGAAAAVAPAGAPLTVLSFNVWFEREETFGARMAAIAALAADATVVGLQEVTDDSFPHLQRELGRRGFGTLFRQATVAPYYCCLASKSTLVGVETVPFPGSRMGRGVLVARAAWPGVGDVLFGVAHLESFVGREVDAAVRAERRAQVARAAATLEEKAAAHGCAAAVLLGDFNWEDSKDGDALAAAGAAWRDAWRDRGSPKASEFTYDGRANGMLKHGFKHRFDRVFVLDRAKEVKEQTLNNAADASRAVATTGFRLVGTAQVGTRTIQHEKKGTLPMFPSDHFGVEVTLEKRAAAAAAPAPAAKKRPAAANAFFQPRKKAAAAPAAAAADPTTRRALSERPPQTPRGGPTSSRRNLLVTNVLTTRGAPRASGERVVVLAVEGHLRARLVGLGREVPGPAAAAERLQPPRGVHDAADAHLVERRPGAAAELERAVLGEVVAVEPAGGGRSTTARVASRRRVGDGSARRTPGRAGPR